MAKTKTSRTALTVLVFLASISIVTFVVFSSSLIHESFQKRKAHSSLEVSEIKTPLDRLFAQILDAYNYVSLETLADSYIENGIVKESINAENIAELSEKLSKLPESHQALVVEKINLIKSNFDSMEQARNLVNSLFTSADRNTVRPDVNRGDLNAVLAAIETLPQENLKNSLTEEASRTLPTIEEAERIAREKAEAERRAREEEQRKIAASWHRLNLPRYINQFDAGYLNGCEAASVLMAASYKGRMTGHSLSSFANTIPITDNPNTGFYKSMTEARNGGEAHWIAPAPLAKYANAQGAGSVNATGSTLDQLDAEVANGNPVIIYLTYRYANPLAYHNGVPDNLHVVVLAGYNSYTGQQVFYDPAPVSGTIVTLSKSRTEYLYNASGRRALVIK
ncbi:C39 family peptidase [Candidatus Saccharibacteria bacterium]|nr:C39 family peptidase [Candidatus Saccharibacteria bacterium]